MIVALLGGGTVVWSCVVAIDAGSALVALNRRASMASGLLSVPFRFQSDSRWRDQVTLNGNKLRHLVGCALALFLLVVVTAPLSLAQNQSALSFSAPDWKPIGPITIPLDGGFASGKMQAIAFSNQSPSLIYAGGGIGPGNSGPYTETGVWKTTDGGATWQQADSGLTDPAVDALWMDQSNPDTLTAGTFSTGIFQTVDGGATWTMTGAFGSTTAFLQSGSTLYAGTAQGIASSTNSGATWNIVKATTAPVRALAAMGSTIYAGLDDGTVLIQSRPSTSWVSVSPTNSSGGTVWSIAVNPSNENNAFVVEWYNYTPDLYVTTNGGDTWTSVSGPSNCYNQAVQTVAIGPLSGTLFAGCDGELYQSLNNGANWSQVAGATWDVRLIVPDAGGIYGNLIIGSDQGIHFLPNGSTSWQDLSRNIPSSILYGLDVSGSTILTTIQDFSPINSFDGGITWLTAESVGSEVGESGSVIFNSGNPQYAYSFTTGGFQFSSNGGQTFVPASGPEFNPAAGNGDLIAVDRSSPSTIYVAATAGVYKSVNWGVSLSSFYQPGSAPTMVAVDPTNSNTIFVGTQAGALLYSQNGGNSWNPSSLPSGTCGSPATLAINPANHSIMLLGMTAPPPCGGILQSTNGGASFTQMNNGIIARSVQCENAAVAHIKYDPSGSGAVVAATNGGLYISGDNGATWTNLQGNAVPHIFTDAVWSGGSLYASTCGEGVLKAPFTAGPVSSVTIQTSPSGLKFSVDGGSAQMAPQILSLAQGPHTISANTPQAGAPGTQYTFTSWTDGGPPSHSITVTGPVTYTATFQTEYQLTISANPANAGTVTSVSGNYYNAGSAVPIMATPNPGYAFLGWTGAVANPTAASTIVTMGGGPQTVIANFVAVGPSINPGGVVPVYSSTPVIQPGEWVSIYGSNLANSNSVWNGDFPTSLGDVSVTIDNKSGYIWFVSPGQINLQAPDDTAMGPVSVVVKTPNGTVQSTVTLAQFSPSFNLLDGKHVAGIIPTPDGSGAYGNGAYDIVGPAGLFSFNTRPVRPGEVIALFGVGFGPTNRPAPAGQVFSGATATVNTITATIGGVPATVQFAGIVEAGLYQLNVVVPNVAGGDLLVQASVEGVHTGAGVYVTVQ